MRSASKILVGCIALLGMSLTAQSAKAGFTIELNQEFSASGTGNLDAGTATFKDSGTSLEVQLTGGADLGKITGFYFNLDNIEDLAAGDFTIVGATTSYTGSITISLGLDSFKADGDGYFDVLVSLDPDTPFTVGDTLTILIADTSYLHADSVSQNGPAGKTGFYAAVHAQSLSVEGTNATSGWYKGDYDGDEGVDVVPAPAGILLLASAIPVLGLRRLLRRKTA